MTQLHRLPLALAALTASSPAFAHEADFLHTHSEGIATAAVIALAIGAGVMWKLMANRARK